MEGGYTDSLMTTATSWVIMGNSLPLSGSQFVLWPKEGWKRWMDDP